MAPKVQDTGASPNTGHLTVTVSLADWYTQFQEDFIAILKQAVDNGMPEDVAIKVAEGMLSEMIRKAIILK